MKRTAIVSFETPRQGGHAFSSTAEYSVVLPVGTKPKSWWTKYYIFCTVTAFAHVVFGSYFYIAGSDRDWPVRICNTYTSWSPEDPSAECFEDVVYGNTTISNPCKRVQKTTYVGQMSPLDLIFTFHFLSFAFQIAPVVAWSVAQMSRSPEETIFQRMINNGLNPLRFLEYAISSTVMVFIIALLVGVSDMWFLILLGTANWSIMIFGLVHEYLVAMRRYIIYAENVVHRVRDGPTRSKTQHFDPRSEVIERVGGQLVQTRSKHIEDQHLKTFLDEVQKNFRKAPGTASIFSACMSHVGGWGAFIGVWSVLIGLFVWQIGSMSKVPDTVNAIVAVQCFLFATFGINQAAGTYNFDGARWDYYMTEYVYIGLSLTSKLVLGWMVFQGTIMSYRGNLDGGFC